MLFEPPKRRRPESEAARGAECARRFLGSNPSPEQRERYWAAACGDECFDASDPT
jgi:hypothetical protein